MVKADDPPEGTVYSKLAFIWDFLRDPGITPWGFPSAKGIRWGALAATLFGSIYLAITRGIMAVILGLSDGFTYLLSGFATFNARVITMFFGGLIGATQAASAEAIAFNSTLGIVAYIAALLEVLAMFYIIAVALGFIDGGG